MGRRMDPSRKRAIRLTVALTAALLLASALVYTSFSAGRDELTAGQTPRGGPPRAPVHPRRHGAGGFGSPPGDRAAVPGAGSEARGVGSGPLHGNRARPV